MQLDIKRRWVFVVTLLVHGAATAGRFAVSPDSQLYIRLADGLVSRDLSPLLHLQAVIWTKFVYVALLAAARAITPAHWMVVMVAINVISSAFVAVMLVDLLRGTRALVAWLFYLLSYEIVQWMHFVLTDLLYTAVAFAAFYFVVRRRPVLVALCVLVAMFIRPPGVVLIPLVLLAQLRPRVAVSILAIGAALVFLVRTAVLDDPARWPFAAWRSKAVQFSAIEKRGEVIDGRTETYRPGASLPLIAAERFARFFQITAAGFSRAHKLVNLAYFVPLYILGILAIIRRRHERLVFLALLWIGTFAFFHAITVIDYDWRHRAPLIPHFVVLAAISSSIPTRRCSQTVASSPNP
jgi:hypothetical protein